MQICVGEDLALTDCWFDISLPLAGTSVKFDAGRHAVVVLLGSHPSLATRKDATVEVVLQTYHKCFSKLCLLFGPFGPSRFFAIEDKDMARKLAQKTVGAPLP